MPVTKRQNTMIAPDQLIAHPENPKIHNDYYIGLLAKYIDSQGFVAPIIIDEKDTILAGHKRCLAALKLNLDKVPCVKIHGLSEAEKIAYVIADNKHTENSAWDRLMLNDQINIIKHEVSIELLGFNDIELKQFETDKNDMPIVTEGDLSDDDDDNDDFTPNLPDENQENNTDKKLSLIVIFDTEESQEELFIELRDRGYKVKV